MKILTDEEYERLKRTYAEYPSTQFYGDNTVGREFSINFKVTDPVLASYVLPGLLYDRLDGLDLGIQVTALNCNPMTRETVRTALIEMINHEFTDLPGYVARHLPAEPEYTGEEIS